MTIVQMLYFSTVCQYMNLTKAAQKLHISQPALSAVIKQIEAECGVMLFQHRANSIHITDEGVVLQQEVEPILQQYRHLETLIPGKRLDRKYIRIGLSPIRGTGIMSEISALFKRRYPEIQLQLYEEGTKQLYEDLDLGKVDLIITTPKREMTDQELEASKEYAAFHLRDIHMVFAVSKSHPLAQRERVEWADIVQQKLILLDESFDMTRYIEASIKQDGYQLPADTCFTSQVFTAMIFIEANAAAGFMPADAVQHNPRVKGLLFPGAKGHPIYLIYRRDRHLFHAAKMFVATAKELLAQESDGSSNALRTAKTMQRGKES